MMLLVVSSFFPVAHDRTHPYDHIVRFGLCFGLGVIAFVRRERVPMTSLFVGASFLLAVLLRQTPFYEAALCLFTAYATIWAALVPATFLRKFNELGDYSYGIYIFAYPLQQLFVHRLPRISPLDLFAVVVPTVLTAAVASWHLLERPGLARRWALARLLGSFSRGSTDPGSRAHLPSADLPDRASA
jgi:peptidoglycan/LPS O-acetylase OafA/YrhL